MIIRISRFFFVSLVFLSCEPNLVDDPIPFVVFDDVVINLSFPAYINLNKDGGFKEVNDQGAGVRGVILYRQSPTVYFAYEKNCSYTPNEACSTVEVHSSGLFMIDPCCTSSFNFSDGMPTGGPAWRPLRKYSTQVNGTVLTITDEIIN
jgi:nitrite reductase/ring-hydroxylating ferredoxin subunit